MSYPEQLGEWVKLRKSTKRDKNLVAFIAVRHDVKEALEAGYAVKTVWTNMHECKRIEFGYDTFLNYVNRLLRRSKMNPTTTLAKLISTPAIEKGCLKPKTGTKPSEPQTQKPAISAGFRFNAAPIKEDLI